MLCGDLRELKCDPEGFGIIPLMNQALLERLRSELAGLRGQGLYKSERVITGTRMMLARFGAKSATEYRPLPRSMSRKSDRTETVSTRVAGGGAVILPDLPLPVAQSLSVGQPRRRWFP